MEKIKNFLYDVSDGLIKLIVVACMVFVIAIKLNTAMPDINILGYAMNSDANAKATQQEADNKVISIDLTQGDPKVDEIAKQEPSQDEENKENTADTVQSDAQNPSTQAEVEKPKEESKPEQSNQVATEVISKTIVVPSGYTSQKIATMLQEERIIKDLHAFLKVVDELGYSSKLRTGTYKLNSDMTYEEIANKLVGL